MHVDQERSVKTPVQVGPDDLKTVVDEIAFPGSQVDTLLVCINAQCMYYPTKIGDRRGTLATPAEAAKWPQSEQQRFRNVEAMFAQGVDPYALLLTEARRHGLESLLTYRMNDIHGDAFSGAQVLVAASRVPAAETFRLCGQFGTRDSTSATTPSATTHSG